MRLQNPPRPLAIPGEDELLRVEPLLDKIEKAINDNGGKLSFDKFMELALYTPEIGYYTGKNVIFGEQGDFITAPEMTPLFSRCIANQVMQVLSLLEDGGDVLEFGAGAGTLACDVLMELEKQSCLPNRYLISEISPTTGKGHRQIPPGCAR